MKTTILLVTVLFTFISGLTFEKNAPTVTPRNIYQSPYLHLSAADNLPGDATVITFTATLTNYSSPTRQSVIIDLPSDMTVHDSGDFYTVNDQLQWNGLVEETPLAYQVSEREHIPYIDLSEYGIEPFCKNSLSTPPCDDFVGALNLGAINARFPLYENTVDLLYISANGVVGTAFSPFDPTMVYTNTTDVNHALPYVDEINHVIAPLWRDNAFLPESALYAAVLSGLTEAENTLYISWHNVATVGNDDITARYALAVDLDGSGRMHFVYDALTAYELVQSGYTIGVENITGERGTEYGYADSLGNRPPSGWLPTPESTITFSPQQGAAASREVTFSLSGDDLDDRLITARLVEGKLPFDVWSSHRTSVKYRTYLPIIVGGQ